MLGWSLANNSDDINECFLNRVKTETKFMFTENEHLRVYVFVLGRNLLLFPYFKT